MEKLVKLHDRENEYKVLSGGQNPHGEISASAAPLVELKSFCLGFQTSEGFRQVLNDIDISVREGEIVGLVGESGSGKTVTAKYLLGVVADNARVISGEARLFGQDLLTISGRERTALKQYIAYVPQDPMAALNPSFTIGGQMVDFIVWGRSEQSLSRYLRLKCSRSAVASAREHAMHLLDIVHIRDVKRVMGSYPHQLSGGMRQRVLLAIAMSGRPRLLVADEPTTALDATVQKRTVDLIQELVEREKLAGLYITHDLGVARWLCSRSYVMLNGSVVEARPTRELLDAPEHAYTRKLVAAIPRLHDDALIEHKAISPEATPVITVRDLVRNFGSAQAVRGVDFKVARGETFALVGESGSGKTTIAQIIAGNLAPTSGSVDIDLGTTAASGRGGSARRDDRVQMVFQDPGSSLNPRQTIEDIVGLPLKLRGMRDRKERRSKVEQLLAKVSVPTHFLKRKPRSLSGGQKQRIAIARALALEPEILILDEPTSALDVSVQAVVLEFLKDLREREGLTYIVITHNLGVVRAIADRTAVMFNGKIVEMGPTDDVLSRPQSEWTRTLIEAVPSVDAEEEENRKNRPAWKA